MIGNKGFFNFKTHQHLMPTVVGKFGDRYFPVQHVFSAIPQFYSSTQPGWLQVVKHGISLLTEQRQEFTGHEHITLKK